MTQFLTFDFNTAYAEIKERAEGQAIINKEAWSMIVEEYVNEKIDLGELDPDQNTELMESQLNAMWPEYEKNLKIK